MFPSARAALRASASIGRPFAAVVAWLVRRVSLPETHRLMTDAVRAHLGLLVASVVLRILWEFSPMLVPAVVGWLIDGLTGKGQPLFSFVGGEFGVSQVWLAAIAIVFLGVVQGIAAWGYTEMSARLSLRVVTRIRTLVFERVLSPNAPALSSGDLLSRALRDTDRLREFVDRVFIRSLTTFTRAVFPITMLFVISWRLALWALAILPLQQVISQVLQRRMQIASRAAADAHARLTEELQMRLAGVEVLHALDAVSRSADSLGAHARVLEAKELRSSRLLAALRALVWTSTAVGLALVWFQGGSMVLSDQLTLGALVSFAGYTAFIFRPLRQMTNVLKTYRTRLASLERIAELTEAPAGHPPVAPSCPVLGSAIDSGRGSWALTGKNGAGKSRLLRALFNTAGGAPEGAAMVPTRPVLTEPSLRDNLILAAPDASEAAMRRALVLAGAGEHAFDLAIQGASSDVALMRRISLAQAILRDGQGPIFVDDPTSGLDEEAAEAMVASLFELTGRRALVIATHDERLAAQAEASWRVEDGVVIPARRSALRRADGEEIRCAFAGTPRLAAPSTLCGRRSFDGRVKAVQANDMPALS